MPGFRLPGSGWKVVQQQGPSAKVRSGEYQLHATQGTGGTWRVDNGYRCLTNPPSGKPRLSVTTTTFFTHTGVVEGNFIEHVWGTQRILVPKAWVEHDEIPGGSSDVVTFFDPSSPAKLVITTNACALCGTSVSGPPYAPEPQNYLPTSGVTATEPVGRYQLAYTQNASTPNYETNGLIVDLFDGPTPDGTTTAAVTLPVSQHGLATAILGSLNVSVH